MGTREWSRRDTLKSVATGVVGLGVGAGVAAQLNEYIVGTTDQGGVTAAASVAGAGSARIDLTAETPLWLVCGEFTAARRESLLARDDVAFVQPDRRLHYIDHSAGDPTDGQTTPWGIDRIDADVAHADGATGEGADIAVVDGGITPDHPDLEPNLADPAVDANHEAWASCSGGDCAYEWADDAGHGTHVAGTIAASDTEQGVVGVAPDARLHALKVCGSSGGCRTSAVVEAVRYAADQGWDVVNLSLGSRQSSPALQAAGQYALESGVVPVAAAGNRGTPDSVGYPAAYEEFLAVSAVTVDDEIAEFSSTGPEVDLAAPGRDVCSAGLDGHDVLSGTSMAAPHVAGAAAQLLADGESVTDARQRLTATAENLGHSEHEQGAGLVDVAAALGLDSEDDGTGDGTACPTSAQP